MTGPRRPRGPRRPKGFEDVPELSAEEVERRIEVRGGAEPPSPAPVERSVREGRKRGSEAATGGTTAATAAAAAAGEPAGPDEGIAAEHMFEVGATGWIGDPIEATQAVELGTAAVPVEPVTVVHGASAIDDVVAERRRLLWRDSATILIGVIIAILAYQTFAPGNTGVPTGSGTPIPSGIAIGSLGPPITLPPGVTFGPIIDPSLGVDATPTPIPVITLGPSPSPSPSPEPSATRKPTPKPSVRPSVRPTVKPSVAPSTAPTPVVTPAPPTVQFTWSPTSPSVGQQVAFDSTTTGVVTSYEWDFKDLSGGATTEDPVHTFLTEGTFNVRLTVSGPGGSTFVEHPVTVTALPP